MFWQIALLFTACSALVILMIWFSSAPYPKDLEDEENKEFMKKAQESNNKKDQH